MVNNEVNLWYSFRGLCSSERWRHPARVELRSISVRLLLACRGLVLGDSGRACLSDLVVYFHWGVGV